MFIRPSRLKPIGWVKHLIPLQIEHYLSQENRYSFIVQVIGDKDSDGFYYGESNGMRGLVPSNMVTEVLVDNPLTAEQLLKDSLTLCRGKHKVKTSLRDHSKGHRQGILFVLYNTESSKMCVWPRS